MTSEPCGPRQADSVFTQTPLLCGRCSLCYFSAISFGSCSVVSTYLSWLAWWQRLKQTPHLISEAVCPATNLSTNIERNPTVSDSVRWINRDGPNGSPSACTETMVPYQDGDCNFLWELASKPRVYPFLRRSVRSFSLLIDRATWLKKSKNSPLRGFTDDGSSVPEASRNTAQQKVSKLELMLGQIANYCPVISRNTIVKNSTYMGSIWSPIRLHFGFEATGAHFRDFSEIHLEHGERPEDLYQRRIAFTEDNLLRSNSIQHHGALVTEELTPTLENFYCTHLVTACASWPPKLVTQRYETELRSRTLASIKPEISQALQSLLDEISATEDAKVMRTAASSYRRPAQVAKPTTRFWTHPKSCPLCKKAGRGDFPHYLSECTYLPETDGKFIAKARQIVGILDCDESDPEEEPQDYQPAPTGNQPTPSALRIQVRQSPYLDTFYRRNSICALFLYSPVALLSSKRLVASGLH